MSDKQPIQPKENPNPPENAEEEDDGILPITPLGSYTGSICSEPDSILADVLSIASNDSLLGKGEILYFDHPADWLGAQEGVEPPLKPFTYGHFVQQQRGRNWIKARQPEARPPTPTPKQSKKAPSGDTGETSVVFKVKGQPIPLKRPPEEEEPFMFKIKGKAVPLKRPDTLSLGSSPKKSREKMTSITSGPSSSEQKPLKFEYFPEDRPNLQAVPKTKSTYKPLMYKGMEVAPEWALGDLNEDPSVCIMHKYRNNPENSKILSVKPSESDQTRDGFDTLKYMRYLDLQAKLHKADHLEQIRDRILSKKPITNEDILGVMIQVYGEMDLRSKWFKLLFENYKESFLEEVEECEIVESKFIAGILAFRKASYSCKVTGRIHKLFSPEEIELYGNLNPLENKDGADWLLLPRTQGFQEPWLTLKGFIAPLEDVGCLKMDLRVMSPKFKAAMSQCLLRLIKNFPCGIAPEVFWEWFDQDYNYKVDKKGEVDIFDMFKGIIYVLKNETDKALLFPAILKDHVCPLEKLNRRIEHLIFQVLGLSDGITLIEDIPSKILQTTGIKVYWEDWGYSSALEFVKEYVKRYSEQVVIESIRMADGDCGYRDLHYLLVKKPSLQKQSRQA